MLIKYVDVNTREILFLDQISSRFPDKLIPEGADLTEFGFAKLVSRYPSNVPKFHFLSYGYATEEEGIWYEDFDVIRMQIPDMVARLRDEIGGLRKHIEFGGLVLPGGILVNTAIADQNRITTVVANMELAGLTEIDFDAANGWVTLTIEQIKGIAGAIARHVQACFSAARRHKEAIELIISDEDQEAAAQALVAYDTNQFWPVQESSPE